MGTQQCPSCQVWFSLRVAWCTCSTLQFPIGRSEDRPLVCLQSWAREQFNEPGFGFGNHVQTLWGPPKNPACLATPKSNTPALRSWIRTWFTQHQSNCFTTQLTTRWIIAVPLYIYSVSLCLYLFQEVVMHSELKTLKAFWTHNAD